MSLFAIDLGIYIMLFILYQAERDQKGLNICHLWTFKIMAHDIYIGKFTNPVIKTSCPKIIIKE